MNMYESRNDILLSVCRATKFSPAFPTAVSLAIISNYLLCSTISRLEQGLLNT